MRGLHGDSTTKARRRAASQSCKRGRRYPAFGDLLCILAIYPHPSCQAAASSPCPHPPNFSTRFVEAGYLASVTVGRIGRSTKFPPQFGQVQFNLSWAQVRQNVHSNEHITASAESGGKSALPHSQFGRSSNINASFNGASIRPTEKTTSAFWLQILTHTISPRGSPTHSTLKSRRRAASRSHKKGKNSAHPSRPFPALSSTNCCSPARLSSTRRQTVRLLSAQPM